MDRRPDPEKYLPLCFGLLFLTLLAGVAVGVDGAGEMDPDSGWVAEGDLAADEPAGLADPSVLAQDDIDAETVVMIADVRADGSAQWRVEYRIRLGDDTEIQAFEGLSDDIETNTSAYLSPFVNRMERTVTTAENETEREMSATNFTVTTERRSQPDAEFGVVTFQFEWSSFAAVDGSRLRAGEAIERLFLDEGVNLQFSWPAQYRVESVDPAPALEEDQRVVWRGQLDFDAGQPSVVLTGAGQPGGDGTAGDGGGEDGTDGETSADSTGDGGVLSPLVGLTIVAVAVLAGIAAVALRTRRKEDQTGATPSNTESEKSAETGTDESAPPAELLSNEERVLRLLEENGGRVKQQAVAEELDWTAAKTSQVVSDLREADSVESFRLGRENVLTLPDVDLETSTGGDDEADSQV